MTTPEKRALWVARQELVGLADDLPNPAWIADAGGNIIWYNRAWYDYTGMTPEDIEGWGWTSVHHAEEIERVTEIWTKAIAAGNAVDLTFRLKGKDGSYRPFLTRVTPIRDLSGAVVRWLGTTVDISAQIELENRLRRAEEDWRNLFEEMQEGLCIAEIIHDRESGLTDAVVIKANKQWQAMTGLTAEQAMGTTVRGTSGDDADGLMTIFARVVETGVAHRDEIHVEALHRWFEVRAYRHSPGRFAAVFLDVSARKVAEEEARRAQENLHRVSRLSAMGAMASILAHELNQPLGAAANFVGAAREQLRRAETIDAAALDALLASGSDSCVRAGEIIRHMREFTASGIVASHPEDITALVGQAVSDFKGTPAAKGIHFTVATAPDLPLVACDQVQIEQVLINLFSNSAQAMSQSPAKAITVKVGFDGPNAILRIEDRGPGFGGREPDQLFEPFWSTKDVSLGLGLPLCRTIVEAHGGSIAAERGAGGGACIVVTLPIEGDKRPT